MTAVLLPTRLRRRIEDAIRASEDSWRDFMEENLEVQPFGQTQLPLAVKYVHARYASLYQNPNPGLYIGSSNFTWGKGVYVTGINEPLSTAIYGRAGVVARFEPHGWRAFDAREPSNLKLYLDWLHAQVVYPEAVLTVHSDYWLHQLRNHFREQFHIDVVMFRPDEQDIYQWYTRADDTWLVVSDWNSFGLASGYSSRFQDSRLTLLVEEEFVPDDPALVRLPQFAISSSPSPAAPTVSALARTAYSSGDILRIQS